MSPRSNRLASRPPGWLAGGCPRLRDGDAGMSFPNDADPADPERREGRGRCGGRAIYFSRSPIPYPRTAKSWSIGVSFCCTSASMPTAATFCCAGLLAGRRAGAHREAEQLRVLERRCAHRGGRGGPGGVGIDAPSRLRGVCQPDPGAAALPDGLRYTSALAAASGDMAWTRKNCWPR